MLTARRDPPFEGGVQDGSRPVHFHPGHAPQQSRFMTGLQVIATLVGIPVGLASAYSIYHSNFTDEARCETLRGNIVSMLDKSADASTLRMLVRRDVVSFENKCGAVDPDAVKAFKTLLARKPAEAVREVKQAEPPKPAPQAKPVEVKRVETKAAEPKAVEPKAAESKAAESKPVESKAAEAKSVETKSVETKPVELRASEPARDVEVNDAKWISSVRDALLHAPSGEADAAATPAPVSAAPAHPLGQLPSAPEVAPTAAPVLPPPVAVTPPPSPPSAGDHPVPPGSIPDAQPTAQAAQNAPAQPGSCRNSCCSG